MMARGVIEIDPMKVRTARGKTGWSTLQVANVLKRLSSSIGRCEIALVTRRSPRAGVADEVIDGRRRARPSRDRIGGP